MSGWCDWRDAEREAIAVRSRELGSLADPACRICKGRGKTQGYVSPGVYATYACPCTGQADWQAGRQQ